MRIQTITETGPLGPGSEIMRPRLNKTGRLLVMAPSAGSFGRGYAVPRSTNSSYAMSARSATLDGWHSVAAEFGSPSLAPGFGPVSWGNQSAVDAIQALVDKARTGAYPWGGTQGKVALFGASMGFMSIISWALQNPDQVGCILGFVPAVSFQEAWDMGDSNRRDQICTAWGISPTPAELPQIILDTADPLTNADKIKAMNAYVEIWSGATDYTADYNPPWVAQAFADASDGTRLVIGPGGHTDQTLTPELLRGALAKAIL